MAFAVPWPAPGCGDHAKTRPAKLPVSEAVPVQVFAQLEGVVFSVRSNGGGAFKMKLMVVSQMPLETTTWYGPAHKLLTEAPVPAEAGVHVYVYVPVPPVATNAIEPSHTPKQLGSVGVEVTKIGSGASMVKVMVVSQPAASVTVNVPGPAQRPVAFNVPWPVPGAGDHKKV